MYLNPLRAQIADGLADPEFTSVYDPVVAKRPRVRFEALGRISVPTPE